MAERRAILLAEDDENDVFLLQRALERAGLSLELIVAHDGQEAVEYLSGAGADKAPWGAPELVLFLLDLKMPRLNGFDVLSWLSSQPGLKDLPVVVLSSSSHEADIERARKLGARDYRVKPSDFVLLVQLVRDLQAQWLTGGKVPLGLSTPPGQGSGTQGGFTALSPG
jgi:CheY-like chemotaxis protein